MATADTFLDVIGAADWNFENFGSFVALGPGNARWAGHCEGTKLSLDSFDKYLVWTLCITSQQDIKDMNNASNMGESGDRGDDCSGRGLKRKRTSPKRLPCPVRTCINRSGSSCHPIYLMVGLSPKLLSKESYISDMESRTNSKSVSTACCAWVKGRSRRRGSVSSLRL